MGQRPAKLVGWSRAHLCGYALPDERCSRQSRLVDGRGVPLSLVVTGANAHDVTQLDAVMSAVVVKRGAPAVRRSKHLCADAGYTGRRAKKSSISRPTFLTPSIVVKRPRRNGVARQRSSRMGCRGLPQLVQPISQATDSLRKARAQLRRPRPHRRGHHRVPLSAVEGQHDLRISSQRAVRRACPKPSAATVGLAPTWASRRRLTELHGAAHLRIPHRAENPLLANCA